MSNSSGLLIAELLASRICHDLISPIAAVNNGLELLEEGEETDPEALSMIRKSARAASLKLQMMRMAFGAGQVLPEPLSLAQLCHLIHETLLESKITLSHSASSQDIALYSIPRPVSKLLINMIIVAVESLPRGGQISVAIDKHDSTPPSFQLDIRGQKIVMPDFKKEIFLKLNTDLPQEPREILPFLINRLGQEVGYVSQITAHDLDILSFRLSPLSGTP